MASGAVTQKGGMSLSQFKPCAAYRDLGVAWLGEIPAHWSVHAARHLIGRIEQGWSPVADDRTASPDEWAVIKLSAVSKGRFLPAEHKALPADLAPERRYEIRDGDFLVTRANTPDLVGDVCVARGVRPKLMLCDLVYRLRLRSDRVSPTFFAYWLLSRAGRFQIEVDARGSSQSMVKLTQGHIRAWTVVLPPLDEQVTIGAFLDRETAKIDAVVAKKERLIALLEEKRTALVTRAVTKGLNSAASMKESGVEWLRQTPRHWVIKPLKYVAKFTNGLAFSPSEWGEDGTPIIRIENLNSGGEFNCTTRMVDERYHVRLGDLLFGWSGNRGTSFGPFLWRREGLYYLNQHIFKLSDFSVNRDWLYWTLRGLTFFVEKQAHGIIGMVHITRGELGRIAVLMPSTDEQLEVAAYLQNTSAELDALVERSQSAIALLREYRTALISAAVTGQINVSGPTAAT